jgi:hypothetical protein
MTSFGFGAGSVRAWTTSAKEEYVCPPCSCGDDNHVYDKPGVCPLCSMTLVSRTNPQPAQPQNSIPRKKLAILIFDGVQIIDYTGPYEVFGAANLDIFTVAVTGAISRPTTE